MDPTMGHCQMGIVTAADLAVMDAIGWKLNIDVLDNKDYTMTTAQIRALIPEPDTWVMLILGFGMVGVASRRRCRATA